MHLPYLISPAKAGKAMSLGAFLVHGRQCLRQVMHKPFDHTCERLECLKRDTSFGVWGCKVNAELQRKK